MYAVCNLCTKVSNGFDRYYLMSFNNLSVKCTTMRYFCVISSYLPSLALVFYIGAQNYRGLFFIRYHVE